MSSASRHFSRCRASAGRPARARRTRITAASCGVEASVSSQPAGRNSRQFSGQDAPSMTAQIETATWQLPTLPSVPEYCRATPGEAVPSLTKPVSSTTQASGAITATARRASRSRTGCTAQVDDETNCCSPCSSIRFQILYRLFFRSFSKPSTPPPPPPAPPLLAAPRLYASQTSCFEISNDLVVWPDMPTRLLPENLSGCSGEHLVDDPAPSLPAHYRRFTATTDRSASRCHNGTQHLPVLAG